MMKKIFLGMFILSFVLLFPLCSDKEDIPGNVPGEKIEGIDSLKSFSGRERVLLQYWISDERVKHLHILWNRGQDSVVVAVPEHDPSDPLEVMIGDGNGIISEGVQVFQFYGVDSGGKRSDSHNTYITIHGDKYESSLQNRLLKEVKRSGDNKLTIYWEKSRKDEIGIEIRYIDISGESKDLFLASETLNDSLVLEEVDFCGYFHYSTSFNPDMKSLDIFHAGTQYFDIPGHVCLDFEEATIMEEFVQGVKNGSLFDEYRNREFYLFKYGNGNLPKIDEERFSSGKRSLLCAIENNTTGTYSRSELEIVKEFPLNKEVCFGFSMYVDNSFKAGTGSVGGTGGWIIFSQFWQDSRTMPPISFEIKQGSTNHLEYMLSIKNDESGPIASETDDRGIRFSNYLDRNSWTRFALRLNASPKGGSIFELYQNGVKVYSSTVDKIGYSEPYDQRLEWRCGLYRSGNVYGLHQVWFDDIRHGETLRDVDYLKVP